MRGGRMMPLTADGVYAIPMYWCFLTVSRWHARRDHTGRVSSHFKPNEKGNDPMRMRTLVLVVMALLIASVVITACGAAPTATPVPTPTAAPTPTVVPTKAPAANTPAPSGGTPKVIPHDIVGREQCLTCHAAGGPKPVPAASHSAYTNAQCLTCHKAK